MTYKIISSQGEIFDIDFDIKSKSISLESTISGRVYLEFVNANIENIILTKEAKEVYNHLWTNEEQFESKVLKMQK